MISVIKTKISWLPKSKSEAPGADGLYWSAALQTQNGHSADQSEPRYIALAWDTTENINKLIDKMSLGAGALNVKRPVAQKGSIAWRKPWQPSERQPPGIVTLNEFRGIITTTHTYLSGGGRSGTETTRYHRSWICNHPQRSAKQSKAKLKYAITCKPLQTWPPPRTSLPVWGSSADPLVLSRG